MPISATEFLKGKSIETVYDKVYALLADGKAYSTEEIAERLGIEQNKSLMENSYFEASEAMSDLRHDLERMGRYRVIVTRSLIQEKKDTSDTESKEVWYHMRRDFLK